jgi:RNA-directed DNA polymerase
LKAGLGAAIITGVGSKSYWHLARTPATQIGMSNAWPKAQGLISVRECWLKAQGYI